MDTLDYGISSPQLALMPSVYVNGQNQEPLDYVFVAGQVEQPMVSPQAAPMAMMEGESRILALTGPSLLVNSSIARLFSQVDYLPGACLAQKYLNKSKDPWTAWSNALIDRDNAPSNLTLRDAEHYLYAFWYVSGNSFNPSYAPSLAGNYMHVMITGYSLYKATAYSLGFNVTQPTWDEFLSGIRGVNDAMTGRYSTIKQCAGQ
jgi:hypothetical protein